MDEETLREENINLRKQCRAYENKLLWVYLFGDLFGWDYTKSSINALLEHKGDGSCE